VKGRQIVKEARRRRGFLGCIPRTGHRIERQKKKTGGEGEKGRRGGCKGTGYGNRKKALPPAAACNLLRTDKKGIQRSDQAAHGTPGRNGSNMELKKGRLTQPAVPQPKNPGELQRRGGIKKKIDGELVAGIGKAGGKWSVEVERHMIEGNISQHAAPWSSAFGDGGETKTSFDAREPKARLYG